MYEWKLYVFNIIILNTKITISAILTDLAVSVINMIRMCRKRLQFMDFRHDLAISGSSNVGNARQIVAIRELCRIIDQWRADTLRWNRERKSLNSREGLFNLRSKDALAQKKICDLSIWRLEFNQTKRKASTVDPLFFFFFSFLPFFLFFEANTASRDNRCRYRRRKQKLFQKKQEQNEVNRLFSQSKSWNWGGEHDRDSANGKQKSTRIYRDQGSLDRGWSFRLDAAEFRSRPTLPFVCYPSPLLRLSIFPSLRISFHLPLFVALFLFSSFIRPFLWYFTLFFIALAVIATSVWSDCFSFFSFPVSLRNCIVHPAWSIEYS